MSAMTIEEARRAVLLTRPGWRSDQVDNEARRMLAAEGRLAALDKLEAQVQARKDAGLDPWPESDAQRWERERFAQDIEDAEARAKAEANRREDKPSGWTY